MATVDWESVALDIQEHVRTKNSHGQRELTDFITDSIARHRQPEGLPERMMRLYSAEIAELFEQLASQRLTTGEGVPSTDIDNGSPHRSDPTGPEGGRNATQHHHPTAPAVV